MEYASRRRRLPRRTLLKTTLFVREVGMTNFAIYVEASEIKVAFTDVSSDETRGAVGKALLNLADQEDKELRIRPVGRPATEYHVTYKVGGAVTRETQRVLSEHITAWVPGIAEVGA
ncbi:hypothetical protein ABT052_40290 [Streptomyces sp. NPDC002766]|uniref:hypothetical protein n=1 Tax=Streptomyces sp. NPDC002766 TaxID=3154429 RepID=UPI0033222E73